MSDHPIPRGAAVRVTFDGTYDDHNTVTGRHLILEKGIRWLFEIPANSKIEVLDGSPVPQETNMPRPVYRVSGTLTSIPDNLPDGLTLEEDAEYATYHVNPEVVVTESGNEFEHARIAVDGRSSMLTREDLTRLRDACNELLGQKQHEGLREGDEVSLLLDPRDRGRAAYPYRHVVRGKLELKVGHWFIDGWRVDRPGRQLVRVLDVHA